MREKLVLLLLFFLHTNLFAQLGFDASTIVDDISIVAGEVDFHVADFDGDNDPDVIWCHTNSDKVAWYENLNGQGNFGEEQILSTDISNAFSVAAGDLDGDGDIDAIAGSGVPQGKVVWFENLDGQGTFGPEQEVSGNWNEIATNISAVDLDGDGDLDILFGFLGGEINWCENLDGQGNFGPNQLIVTGLNFLKNVSTADIDQDGDLDVFSGSAWDEKLAWYENDGDGNFGVQQLISADANEVEGVAIGDFDGDDDLDVAATFDGNEKVVWFENTNGQGAFGDEQVITINPSGLLGKISATDLDLDGDMDLVYTNPNFLPDQVYWFENLDGLGTFSTRQFIGELEGGAVALAIVDMDSDGDMDIVAGAADGDALLWYENLGLIKNKITGTVRFDLAGNGCSSGASPASGIMVLAEDDTERFSTISFANGLYQLSLGEGEFTSSVSDNLPNYFSVDSGPQSHDFQGIGNIDTVNYCISSGQSIEDLSISFYPISEARPGFNATYQIVFQNFGSSSQDGNILLTYNDQKMQFLNASEVVTAQTANSLSFEFEQLHPFEIRTINLEFNVLPPPTVNIDELLEFDAVIEPLTGDNFPADNLTKLEQLVIGSFDPNDIVVVEGATIRIDEVDNYLHYIIRFQNTGTAEAINVRIENMLDQNLDWNTLKVESASHAYQVEIANGNHMKFNFNGIYLPDSTHNEPASHGFITYKIKPKGNIMIGEMVPNKADIFFDFNEPIETNQVTTEIVDISSVNEQVSADFLIFPNPADKLLVIKTENRSFQVSVYNQAGKLVLSESNQNTINISTLNSGIYYCELQYHDRTGGATRKFFKK